jgi:DNA-binding NarL/FixJ family response regulator
MHYEGSYINDCIKHGARAFLPHNCGAAEVVKTINKVHTDGYSFDNKVSLLLAKSKLQPKFTLPDKTGVNSFTPRELEILCQICQNRTNKEIAHALSLSIRTVEGHRLKLMKKTNCKNAIALTHFAANNKLLSPLYNPKHSRQL